MSGQQRPNKIGAIDAIDDVRRSLYLHDGGAIPLGTVELPLSNEPQQQEEAIAPILPVFDGENQAIAPLTNFLGPLLTVANPVWRGDPVPGMRMLQKKLVAHALTLDEQDRAECMGAIATVENAVQLRLRWQQMRMTEAELNTKPENVKTP